jgi:hypothetical protein
MYYTLYEKQAFFQMTRQIAEATPLFLRHITRHLDHQILPSRSSLLIFETRCKINFQLSTSDSLGHQPLIGRQSTGLVTNGIQYMPDASLS